MYDEFLNFIFPLAKGAGEIQLAYFRGDDLGIETKSNAYDVVTRADKESEAYIVQAILGRYPGHGILGEEGGVMGTAGSDYRWVIDPLDGTTNFASGLPVFCVSIALEHHKEAVIGVVFAPRLGECFHAVKGAGAWLNGQPIRCSGKTELSKAVVATGMPYDRNDNTDNNLDEISRMALRVRGIRRMGSAAIDLCYTAAGFLDAYWELNLNRWDVAAGQLIAEEAGAIIEPLRSDRNHSILASNPGLHATMRKILLPQRQKATLK